MDEQTTETSTTEMPNTGEETTNSTLMESETTVTIPEKFLVDGQPNYDAMTKAYVAMEKKMGSKMPVSDITEYDFSFQTPDSWNQDEYNDFKSVALENGFSKEQFNLVMGLYEQNVLKVLDQYTPNADRAQQMLEDDWGDDYVPNMKAAAKAIESFYPDAMSDPDLGSNPKFIKAMAAIGKQMREDNAPGVNNTGKGAGLSKLEIGELMSRPDYTTNKEVQAIVTNWYNTHYN